MKIKVWQGIDIEYVDELNDLCSKEFRDKADKIYGFTYQYGVDRRSIIAMVTGSYYPKTHLKNVINSLIDAVKNFKESGNGIFADAMTAFKDGCMYAHSQYLDKWNRNNPITRGWTDIFERNIIEKWKSDVDFHRGALICMKYLEGMFDG